MKPTVEIYIGAPVSVTEASALEQLVAMLSNLGEPSFVFANFRCGPQKRQVDFVVITPSHAAHLELKDFQSPIEAPNSGPWFYIPVGVQKVRIPSPDGSPREQAIQTKHAISDAMRHFARKFPGVPRPKNREYYKEIESAVCVYPDFRSGSQIGSGDSRSRIWSFKDCIRSINAQPGQNNWPLEVWERFANDYLQLEKVPLAAAISSQVYEARSQLEILCSKQAEHFENLIADTVILGSEPAFGGHTLILGRKGAGKTTLAQRITKQAANNRQLCFFVRAMKYRGDFGKVLQQSVSPFSSLSQKYLVETAELCGAGILVVLDGIDQITDPGLREDLLLAAASFFERHPCSVLVTASCEIALPPNIRGKSEEMSELSQEDRQKVYRHYAPLADASLDLTPFPTPHDLKVAAKAAAKLPKNATPALVYDTYVRVQLGLDIASVGVQVCRAIAHEAFKRFSPFLSHQEFDEFAERKLRELGAPLSLIDRIKTTRLFEVDIDGISFAHDLLVNHLVAAELVHRNRENLWLLKELIAKPLYRQITGEIISRIPDHELVTELFCTFGSSELFECTHSGQLGWVLKDRLEVFLRQVLDRAEQELDSFQLDCDLSNAPRGLQCSPVTTEPVLTAEMCALELIARHIELHLPRVAEILDRYGKCLMECAQVLARKHKLRTAAVISSYLHGELGFSSKSLRCSQIAHVLSNGSLHLSRLSSAVVSAFDATFSATSELNPITDYVMCGVWEQATDPDVSKVLALFRKCWSSGTHYLKVQATEMLTMQANRMVEKAPDQLCTLVQEVESRLGDDPFLNTGLVDTLSMLGSLESPVSMEGAEEEANKLLTELHRNGSDSANELGITLSQQAYRFVSNIFEEIFSEPYCHAYSNLDAESKAAPLNAAASGAPAYSMMTLDWILGELARLAHPSAAGSFERYCSTAPKWKETFVGETTKHFLLSVIGLSQIATPLPAWRDEDRSPSIAWRLMRDLFYAYLIGGSDGRDLWIQLESEDPLGGVSVLLHIFYYLNQMRHSCPITYHPEATSPREVKRLMEIGLKNFDRIDFGDVWHPDPFALLCRTLEKIGDEQSLDLLEAFISDQQKGPIAIATIRCIKQRLRCRESGLV